VKPLRRLHALVKATLIRVKPTEPGDYLDRGIDRHLHGDLAGAIADYSEAIARYSEWHSEAIVYLTRGNARRDHGDLAGAIADYTQAITRDPGYASAYLSRGLAYQEAGDTERAIADLKMVRELSPDPHWRRQAEEALRALAGEGE
jgi:tetratricopeptide (TPR) repeat protein